jgi:hypothetical protein
MDSPTASPIIRVECELEDDEEPDWDDSERGNGEELGLVVEWVERGREVLGVVVEWRRAVGRVAAVVVGWRVMRLRTRLLIGERWLWTPKLLLGWRGHCLWMGNRLKSLLMEVRWRGLKVQLGSVMEWVQASRRLLGPG